MRNLQIRLILSSITLFSILMVTLSANAEPIKFKQVRQIINAKPGKAKTNAFARLSLINSELNLGGDEDKEKKDDKNKPVPSPTVEPQQQDNRVITETTSEIVEDEVCDCVQPAIATKAGFPKFALLGLAAIPLLFLIPRDKETPTPTPTLPTTQTPTPPTDTPTPTPTMTPTPPPTMTPTPPPEPVPEPMTILLFGTGLASVGMAARKKFGKKAKEKTEE